MYRRKIIALALTLTTLTLAKADDVRTMAGRIIDVTAAAAGGPQSAYSNYWITGQIKANYPAALFIEHYVGIRYFMVQMSQRDILSLDNTELLVFMRAARYNNTNGWTQAQFGRLPILAESAKYFTAREIKTIVAITNHRCTQDSGNISILAFPSTPQNYTINGMIGRFPTFDAGTPYDLTNNTNKYLHTLTPTGLKKAQFRQDLLQQNAIVTKFETIVTNRSTSPR